MLKVDNSIVIVVHKEWMKQVCMSYISIHIYFAWKKKVLIPIG